MKLKDLPVYQVMIVAVVLGGVVWHVLDEATGNRALRDEAARRYYQVHDDPDVGEHYYNAYGDEIPVSMVYSERPVGWLGRTLEPMFLSLFFWLPVLGFVLYRLRGSRVALSEVVFPVFLTLILVLSMVTLYLVDLEALGPKNMVVRRIHNDSGPVEVVGNATYQADPFNMYP